MERRRFLAVAAVLSSGAGCLDVAGGGPADRTTVDTERTTVDTDRTARADTLDGTETDADTETGTERTAGRDDISIAISTTSPNGTPVQLAVSSEEGAIVEERVAVSPDGARVVDTGIDEKGGYELTITPDDGRTRTYSFHVGDYDLRMGSNVVVSIDDDVVRIVQEE